MSPDVGERFEHAIEQGLLQHGPDTRAAARPAPASATALGRCAAGGLLDQKVEHLIQEIVERGGQLLRQERPGNGEATFRERQRVDPHPLP